MRQHVDEVDDDDVEVVLLQVGKLMEQLLGTGGVVDLVVGELIVAAVALYLCLYQRTLIEVLTLLLVLIDPQLWEHLRYLGGHQSAEDSITCILCRRG